MSIHVLTAALRRHALTALAALSMALAGPVLAADFYASPTGNDANSCSSAADPCQTIQAAIDKAMAGDTVHVGQGSYPFTSNRIVIDKAGLKLVGDHSPFDASSTPGAPVLAADASVLQAATGSASGTSGMVWVKNVPNVEVRNLYMELTCNRFFGFCVSTPAKEGIVATGAVDGLVVDNNYIKQTSGSGTIGISVNLAAGGDSSVPSAEPRSGGQFVTISNNVVEPTVSNTAAPKRAIAVYNSVGTISGNQVAATTQDMWIQNPNGGSSHQILTIADNWFYGKLQLYLSSGTNLASTVIDGNHFDGSQVVAAGQAGNGSEAHSLRVMGANGGSPTTISNNQFTGFGGNYRALWVMSRPKVTIVGNTFTPAANQSDFTAIVVGNREVWNGLPLPNPYDVTIQGNTFNANGAPTNNKGKAILFLDDNDANGAASFTQARVGGNTLVEANSFDADIGWYVALDDRTCNGNNHTSGSAPCNGSASYAIGAGFGYNGGSNASSQKRPFKWDIDAAGNSFGGVYMPTMTQAEYDAVVAKTWDSRDAATAPTDTGTVQYGSLLITTGTVVFAPTSFTYDGNAHNITATLAEDSGATCVVTPATVTDAGDTAVSATCISAQYNVTGQATIHVAKAAQAITGFAATPANPTYAPNGTFTVAATGGASGEAVTIASTTPTVCTVNGNTVTMLAAGSCVLTADQAGNANYEAASQATLDVTIGQATATLSLSNLAQTYDSTAKTATVTATPSGVSYSVTYDGQAQAPTNAGSYAVVAHITDANYTGSDATGTLVIAKAAQAITGFAATPANPVYSAGGTFTVAATGGASGEAVTFASTTPTVCTVSGNTVTMLAAGSCVLTADQAGDANHEAAPQATLNVTIGQATATLSLGNLAQTYDGTAKTATVMATPSGVSYSVTYDGAAQAPINAGSYAVVAHITDANYTGSDATGTLVIAKAAQAITGFAATPANPTYAPNGTFTVAATGGASGEAVTFASTTPTVCTVNGNTVTMLSAGSCVLTADQAGNANYEAASQATLDVTIGQATATLSLGNLAQTYDGTAKTATVTATPSSVSYSVTYDGAVQAPTNAGSYAVVAHITDANYTGSDATGTLVISKAAQAITGFAATPSNPTFTPNGTFMVAATGGASGEAVTFASTTPTVCTVSGNTVTMLAAGSCVLTADQAGDANHEAAPQATLNVTIGQATATLSLGNLAQTYDGTAKTATVTATPSGVTYSVTYDGAAQAPTNAGSYAVVAHITDANYTGSDATGTLVIAKAAQAITGFAATPANPTYAPNGTFTVAATGGASGEAVTIASTTPTVCTVNGNTVTMLAAGTCTLTADQTGDANHEAAPQAELSVTIGQATATLSLSNLAQTYDGTAKTATVTATPSGVSYSVTYDGQAQAPTNAGSYAVVAHITDANYTGSDATGTLVIAKAAQAITNFAATPANPVYSANGTFTVAATGGASGEAVTFASTTPTVCTVSGTTVTMLSAGSCVLTADQAGNANYEAAPQVSLDVEIAVPLQPDLVVTIDDGRDYVQYGKPVSYTITVTNVGNADADNVTVASVLPATLIGQGWRCMEATSASCKISGTGDLQDATATIQVGGHLTYVIDTTVNDDPQIGTDEINVSATATVANEADAGNNSATDTTISVLFRDGFELGGDGAEPRPAEVPAAALTLNGTGSQVLHLSTADLSSTHVTMFAVLRDAGGDHVALQALRRERGIWVRLVRLTAGRPTFGQWSRSADGNVALGLATTTGNSALILVGGEQDLQMPLQPGTDALQGWQKAATR